MSCLSLPWPFCVGYCLGLSSDNLCGYVGFCASECAVPRGNDLDAAEAQSVSDVARVARARGDDHMGIQAMEGGGDDKREL